MMYFKNWYDVGYVRVGFYGLGVLQCNNRKSGSCDRSVMDST
jgi:hypothetical protein